MNVWRYKNMIMLEDSVVNLFTARRIRLLAALLFMSFLIYSCDNECREETITVKDKTVLFLCSSRQQFISLCGSFN